MITKRQLKRSIRRAKIQLAILEAKQDSLSKHGYWEIGYLRGRIATLEDWLDELMENATDNKE